MRAIATNMLSHLRFLDRREMVLRLALEDADPSYERVIRSYLFWTLVSQGHIDAAIEASRHSVLDRNRVTMLHEARVLGYPIPEASLLHALKDFPSRSEDRASASLSIDKKQIPAISNGGPGPRRRATGRGTPPPNENCKLGLPRSSPKRRRYVEGAEPRPGPGRLRRLDARRPRARANPSRDHARPHCDGRLGGHVRSIMGERNRIIRAWLGELLLEMDRPRDALVYFESLGPGWPLSQDPMMYFRMGQIRDRLGALVRD